MKIISGLTLNKNIYRLNLIFDVKNNIYSLILLYIKHYIIK